MRILLAALFTLWSYMLIGQNGPCDQVQAGFSAQVNGAVVQFSNSTSGAGAGTLFFWNFGDGTTSQDPQPTHDFGLYGSYEVCLTVVTIVEGPNGQPFTCDDIHCQLVQVGPEPICSPNFVVAMDWDDVGEGNVVFVATSTFPNTNFVWYFGDGQQAEGSFVEHTYAEAGSYAACVSGWYFNELVGDTCWIEDCEIVVVEGAPCSGLQACFVTNVSGNGVYFFDNCSSQQGNAQFLWNFGDGTTSTITNVEHLFVANGTYEVCLKGLYNGCSFETCQAVVVTDAEGNPCDALNAQFTPVVGGFGVNIQNAVVDQNWVYQWSFGDGATGYGPNTGHQYTASGVYDICLVVYTWDPVSLDTCLADHCETVTIDALDCDPNFAVELAWIEGTSTTVNFIATSNHPNTNFIWYFGDGTEGSGAQVVHTYPENGTYYPCVTGWYFNELTQDTCYIEDCTTIVVGGPNTCDDVVACFEPVFLPNNIVFFEDCSSAPIGTDYLWDFGDGSTSQNPIIEHVYQPGTYTACLVLSWENCVDSTCTTFTVGGGGSCEGLVACFEPEPFENGAYFFVNCSQTLPIAIPVSYFWDFGDGTTSVNAQPDHLFDPGTYTICLTITQGDCVDTTCVTITVGGGLPCEQHQADFTTTPNGLAIQFTSTSTGTSANTEYLWSFGDGSIAGGPNPLHDYAELGVYEVCLQITTVVEAFPGMPVILCQDSVCYTVDVGFNDFCDQLQACFLPLPFENGAYLLENCSQVLPIDIPAYAFWDFGDGATSTEWLPTHSFAPGIYSVCLTVVHGECVDTTCTTITVSGGPGCDPNYTASFTYTVQNNAVIFQANIDTPTLGVVWTFPSGDQAYEPVHTHLFEPPGPFEVCLSTWYWSEQIEDSCWAHTCQVIDPFNTSTGVQDNSTDDVRIYPVPAHDRVSIEGLRSGAAVQLFSADGRLISSSRVTSDLHQVDVSGLAPGAYLLTLEQDGARSHHRLVVE